MSKASWIDDAALRKLPKAEFGAKRVQRWHERFQWLVALAVYSVLRQVAGGVSAVGGASRIPNGAVLLLMFSVIVFLVGLVSEQISTLRFEGRR